MKILPTHLLFFLLFLPVLCPAQKAQKVLFLPSDRLFPAITLDPNESQAYATIAPYWEEGKFTDRLYLPFGLGFYKGFLRWNTDKPFEIGFDFSAHTQFEWATYDGKMQRNILNADFKVSVLFQKKINARHSCRLRFFHVSSHLGDDYIIRNGVSSYFPNPNNYEQLDFTWSWQNNRWRYYGGTGLVVRPHTIRKRFSAQAGAFFEKPLNCKWPLGLIGGVDVKILAQNDFEPGIKTAFGLRTGQPKKKPLRIMAEYYRGHLPYSPFEFKHVQWIGAGLYFVP